MAKIYGVLVLLSALIPPALAQGVNTSTGKPVSASGEPASTIRPPQQQLPPATSVLSNQYRGGVIKRRRQKAQ